MNLTKDEMKMKTIYKYIKFVFQPVEREKGYWLCLNKKSNAQLGLVKFEKNWKQWVFVGFEDCVFSMDCLSDIIDFIKHLK